MRKKLYKCISCSSGLSKKTKTGLCWVCFRKLEKEKILTLWKETGKTGCTISTGVKGCIRKYIYNKQNHKCAICDLDDMWNNKPLKFILDHIDGDASNSSENNVRLICPNCDSQLDTYKSRNKNSARKYRKLG
jgi:hypothetical protein